MTAHKPGATSPLDARARYRISAQAQAPTATAEPNFARFAAFGGTAQARELRSVLVTFDFEPENLAALARHERDLHKAFVLLLRDPEGTKLTATTLNLLGYREGRESLLAGLPAPPKDNADRKLASDLVCARFDPRREKEWLYPRVAAIGEADDGDRNCAILLLKLSTNPRRGRILEEALTTGADRGDSVREAIQYIRSRPAPLKDVSLNQLIERAVAAVQMGERAGTPETRYNKSRQLALVDFPLLQGCRSTCPASFHRENGLWSLRSLYLISIAMPPPPPPLLRR